MDSEQTHQRPRLIEAITAPLGFFVLALLIVEAFLATVLISGKLDTESTHAVWLGVAMFVFVVLVVATLVWSKPEHLTFTKDAHIEKIKTTVRTTVTDTLRESTKLQELLRDAVFYRAQKRFLEAVGCYERALGIEPLSDEAQIGLAVAKSYADTTDLSEPLRLLDEVIERSPDSEKALYNRACLKLLSPSQYSKTDWMSDLRAAVERRGNYAEYARRDEDFRDYRADPEFIAVLNKASKQR